jgi:ATP-binding cassette subfamily B (MDR/TAP) protein 1
MAIASYITGFTVSWKLSIVMVSLVPFIIIGGISIMYLMRYSSTLDSRAYEAAGAVAEETINNIKTVASFSRFDFEIKRYKDNADISLKSGLRVGLYTGITMGFLFFIVFASYTLAVWYGSILISNQEYNPVTHAVFKVGDILIVLFTVVFGSFSIGQAAPNISAISQACSEAWEFFELRKRKPLMDLSKSTKKPEKETIIGEITFKNVSFTYPKTPNIKLFHDLNMKIEPNKITAIVGPSGSGKTTIVSLIERLYDAEGGEIMIDDINVKELDVKYFRSLIGYVPQEPVLFNQSIRENVIFGRENITNEQVWEALRKASADEFVKTEDDLDFIVGMKGGKLSGGQKQRIAIARAILTKPKFLILDEATSALDYESEKVVQKALNEVSKGITTIIVAHRLSTILNADKIVVLKNGKIVEEGNHRNLLASNGVYSELIRNQVGAVGFTVNEEEQEDEDETAKEKKNTAMENDRLIDNINKNRVLMSEPKLTRKNSFERLQESILELKKKKEEIEKQAGDTKKKLWPILLQHPYIVVGAAIFTCATGASWPAYGIIIADTIQVLGLQINLVAHYGYMQSMYFLALAGGALISYFFQAYF